jgi:toxin FitB
VTGYLLDTNVVSELRRTRADAAVVAWHASITAEPAFLSVLVVGEIRRGITRLAERDPAQAGRLDAWLVQLETAFADRVLPVDGRVADIWGRMDPAQPVPVVDGLMAATAIVYDLTFVTRNVQDVVSTGARVLNPWTAG